MTKTDAYQAGYDHGFTGLLEQGPSSEAQDVPSHVPDERVADYTDGYVAGVLGCLSAQQGGAS